MQGVSKLREQSESGTACGKGRPETQGGRNLTGVEIKSNEFLKGQSDKWIATVRGWACFHGQSLQAVADKRSASLPLSYSGGAKRLCGISWKKVIVCKQMNSRVQEVVVVVTTSADTAAARGSCCEHSL